VPRQLTGTRLRRADTEERAFPVDVEHFVSGRLIEALDQPVLADTGAVDQHVEAAEAVLVDVSRMSAYG
jgi:regulator of PEP synthase PpsR (kinase-PPPase family)